MMGKKSPGVRTFRLSLFRFVICAFSVSICMKMSLT